MVFRFKEGLHMEREPMDEFWRRCEANLTIMSRCRFVLGGGKRLKSLIDLLKEYNESLREFSLKLELGRMARGFDHLSGLVADELLQRAEAAAHEAEGTLVAAEAQRYRDLALAATFLD